MEQRTWQLLFGLVFPGAST